MGIYDRALTMFSPDGRIFQVEYAQVASERGTPVVFAVGESEISVAIEKKMENKLRISRDDEKFREIDEGIFLSFSGLWPDSSALLQAAISECRRFSLEIGQKIRVEELSILLSEYIQSFTMRGGVRPFGAKLVVFGFTNGLPRASVIEPDGNHSFYSAGSIGQKGDKITESLESFLNRGVSPLTAVIGALSSVGQRDPEKIAAFLITENSSRILNTEEKAEILRSISG